MRMRVERIRKENKYAVYDGANLVCILDPVAVIELHALTTRAIVNENIVGAGPIWDVINNQIYDTTEATAVIDDSAAKLKMFGYLC